MNQHLLVKMRQFGVANLGNSLAITYDRRLELDGPALRHFSCAAE